MVDMNVNTPDDIKNKPDKVNLNNFDRWDAEMPALDMPEEDMPDIDIPDVNMPAVEMPDVDMSDVDMPDVDMPEEDMPDLDIPDVDMPNVVMPDVNMPCNVDVDGPVFRLKQKTFYDLDFRRDTIDVHVSTIISPLSTQIEKSNLHSTLLLQ